MKFSAWKSLSATSIAALLCTTPGTASAFVAGAKASGMAGTGIAYPQDAFAGAYNPAGIVEVGDRTDLGVDLIRDHGHADIRLKHAPKKNHHTANTTHLIIHTSIISILESTPISTQIFVEALGIGL